MSTDRAEAVEEANSTLLDQMAGRIAKVMQVSHGAMSAWTAETIRGQLETSLSALDAHPEAERTHGLLRLERSLGTSSDYMVSLNLGVLIHFSEEAAHHGD